MLFSLVYVLMMGSHSTFADKQSIQQQIDQAKPGDTIEIPEGDYDETLTINQPIHLIGTDGVTFTHKGSDPIITIHSDDVVIEHMHLKYTNDDKEASGAIFVEGNHNVLHDIHIETNSYGVHLDGANDNELSNLTINGDQNALFKDRDHGIYVWKSHNNIIHDTRVKHVQDGIYMEQSSNNHVYSNIATHSRYGYHLMFTKNSLLEENESYENVSGMMIMGTDGTVATHNILRHNQENLQSLGLLLFDVTNAMITENDLSYNRIGIFVEDASDNEINHNYVHGNYIGLQFKGAYNNHIYHNTFVANVVPGQAEDSADNNTNKNYWSDHLGIDMTGDGTSDLKYTVDPFFLNITDQYPPFQLLFQAPGMIFLEQLIHTPIEQQFVDQAPLMENPLDMNDEDHSKSQGIVLLFSMTLLFFSSIIIYLGVKQQ